MKRNRFLLLLFSSCTLSLASCEKVKDTFFPSFEAEVGTVTIAIPVTAAGANASATNTITFNLDSVIKEYTTKTFGFENLSSVKVKDLSFVTANGDNLNDFSNFETVSLTLYSNVNRTPVAIINSAVPDKPMETLNIPTPDCPELKDYLWGDQLTYTVNGKTRRATTMPLDVAVFVTLSLK